MAQLHADWCSTLHAPVRANLPPLIASSKRVWPNELGAYLIRLARRACRSFWLGERRSGCLGPLAAIKTPPSQRHTPPPRPAPETPARLPSPPKPTSSLWGVPSPRWDDGFPWRCGPRLPVEDASDASLGQPEGAPCQVVLQGAELNGILQAFAPLRTSLLDSLLVMGDRGILIHNTIFGEQVFLPLEHSQFSRYRWRGPTAAFLSLVDQKRSLLSVFRANQYPDLRRVELAITGQAPFRTLVQRIWTTTSDGEAVELASETLMKRELTSFVVLVPQGTPDVQLRLTRPQLTKVLNATGADSATPTTFELGVNGKFSVFTTSTCVTFAAREEGVSSSTSTQVQILSNALTKAGQAAANAKTVYGKIPIAPSLWSSTIAACGRCSGDCRSPGAPSSSSSRPPSPVCASPPPVPTRYRRYFS